MTLLERVMQKVVVDDNGCWIWTAAKRRGYGRVAVPRDDGKPGYSDRAAHRVVYELLRGQVGPGLDLHHECEIRACVNPDHLTPLTKTEHRQIPSKWDLWRTSRTHCKNGHPFGDPPMMRKGFRHCQQCCRDSARRLKAAKKAAKGVLA